MKWIAMLLFLTPLFLQGETLNPVSSIPIDDKVVGVLGQAEHADKDGGVAHTTVAGDIYISGGDDKWCWNFSESGPQVGGTIAEQCQSSKALTVTGTLDAGADAEGTASKAVGFGSDSAASDTFFQTSGAFSVAAWVEDSDWSNGAGEAIYSNGVTGGTGWRLIMSASAGLQWDFWGVNSVYYAGIYDISQEYHHIATVYDGTIARMYIDTVLVGQVSAPGISTGGNFEVGSWNGGGSNFSGKIDEVVAQKGIAWDQAQIERLYYASTKASLHGGLGHTWTVGSEPGTNSNEVLALYLFADGAMTTDETGSYDLDGTGGTPVNCDGITGDDYCVELDGSSDEYSQSILLDTMVSALAIDFWYKADDHVSGGVYYRFFEKINIASEDYIDGFINDSGQVGFRSEQNNGGTDDLLSTISLNDGPQDWRYAVFTWDTVNGKRIFETGIQTAQNTSETTLPKDGTGDQFYIGSGGASGYFPGKISMLRVRDKILSSEDIIVGMTYTAAHLFGNARARKVLQGWEDDQKGIDGYFDPREYERSTDSTNLYLELNGFDPLDQITIWTH